MGNFENMKDLINSVLLFIIMLCVSAGFAFVLTLMSQGSELVPPWVIYVTCILTGLSFLMNAYLMQVKSKESTIKLCFLSLFALLITFFILGMFGPGNVEFENNELLKEFYLFVYSVTRYVPMAASIFTVAITMEIVVRHVKKRLAQAGTVS